MEQPLQRDGGLNRTWGGNPARPTPLFNPLLDAKRGTRHTAGKGILDSTENEGDRAKRGCSHTAEMQKKILEEEIAAARKAIDALYTPLDEALELLRQRRTDEKLVAAVQEFHREQPPDFLPDEPCAFWTRHVTTPNHEFRLFAATVGATCLQPLCAEYSGDIFVSCNRDKHRLCRPSFEVRPKQFRGLAIMGYDGIEGRRLRDLELANGMPLLDFHHGLLRQAFPGFENHLRDYSQWFPKATRAGFCYLHYLALFISNGILFENFIPTEEGERRFVQERVLPSFARAIEIFGVKPLIVPLLPFDSEDDDYWRAHPGELHPIAKELQRRRVCPCKSKGLVSNSTPAPGKNYKHEIL